MERTKLYTVKEMCEVLGVCRTTLQKFVCEGKLRRVKVGEEVRFTQTDLDRYIARNTKG